jgi:hypothetical protein
MLECYRRHKDIVSLNEMKEAWPSASNKLSVTGIRDFRTVIYKILSFMSESVIFRNCSTGHLHGLNGGCMFCTVVINDVLQGLKCMLKTKNKFNKMRIIFIIKHKSRYHGSDHNQGSEEGLWSMELET